MSVEDQFKSLTLELEALKDRVRSFRQTKHWQTDGEWKELVLRTILSRHLPRNLEPLRGFVTNGDQSTHQIDVLIYDNSKPVLFRSGDLVFVTPDAVGGIIEVKSTISTLAKLKAALLPLASNIEQIRGQGSPTAFSCLFAFDSKFEGPDIKAILRLLNEVSLNRAERVIDIVALGSSVFVLYWEGSSPEGAGPQKPRWHGYYLQRMAPGYFVSNVVYSTSPRSVQGHLQAWFPSAPKEVLALGESEDGIRRPWLWRDSIWEQAGWLALMGPES